MLRSTKEKGYFMWSVNGLVNESDVEQKFIFPFLVEPVPLGLGLPDAVIQTKVNIRRFEIDKGSASKLYFPDYVIVTMGFPVVVIEAKHPSESVAEGFRQARLYAVELNALFVSGLNPVNMVIATNGVELWYGNVDASEPTGKVSCDDLGPYSPHVARLIELISWPKLQDHADLIARKMQPSNHFKPRRLLGGVGVQNEEIGQNKFGATLTATVTSIFNPTTVEDRAYIARMAYIPSKRRERYVDPIDRVIRAARPPSEIHATGLEDSSRPTEIIKKLAKPKELEHKVLLIIGSVGSGKSTFIDHLLETALPRDVVSSMVTCRLNMNAAPVTANEIYSWLRLEIIKGCQASLPEMDFDDLDVIEKVLSVEINKFKKGVGKTYLSQPEVYQTKYGENLQKVLDDERVLTEAYVRFTCGERGKLLLVVLDNCDKKNRDEQLLMFEAAQWLQKEFRCLVILPLRDETYDNHRDQPPLDTALKDLVFRIEPPLFQQVLIKRVQLALRELGNGGNESLRFTLPNGYTVEYPKSDQAYYLTTIVKSLFEHDRFVRRIIVGLSGRNMRRALEIFLEFCNSGHIGEDQIFKIRQSEGGYTLPFHQVATVLLRMNRRYYDSDNSYIKNIFSSRNSDTLPGYFCRYMILRWLEINFSSSGTSGLRGYFPKRDIKRALVPYGLEPDVIDREFNYLLTAQCVIAEHLRLDSVADDDLVRLGPAGFVHLELVSNINYLAAISEDTFFTDRLQAERICTRIKNIDGHLQIKTAYSNADEIVTFLESVRGQLNPPNGSFMEDNMIERITNFESARDTIDRVAKSHADDPWFDADKRIERGSRLAVTVVNTVEFGCFVEFDDGLHGLVHKNNLKGNVVNVGDRVEVEVLWIDVFQKKMGLKLTAVLAVEMGDIVEGAHLDPSSIELPPSTGY
ncbi:S1 RNA-binding domain-containing protein [Pseudomonas syringae]|nr:S1 RNA-binding domain-containing protein [Pseudomonas syringae]